MKSLFAAALGFCALVSSAAFAQTEPAQTALAQSSFDGKWSVLIVTEQGNCDRAYRYPLLIQNGNVLYGGKKNFNVSGQVQPSGAVVVSVTQGNAGAIGTGRLNGKYGSGKWEAPQGGCSGRWQADKRG
jgi:hypothetical protein